LVLKFTHSDHQVIKLKDLNAWILLLDSWSGYSINLSLQGLRGSWSCKSLGGWRTHF